MAQKARFIADDCPNNSDYIKDVSLQRKYERHLFNRIARKAIAKKVSSQTVKERSKKDTRKMSVIEEESTLGDVYDDIQDRLATARTKALMGEREEALGILQGASLDYTRFRDVLRDYPGQHALNYAFDMTMIALRDAREPYESAQKEAHSENNPQDTQTQETERQMDREEAPPRRRTRRAA